VLIVAAIRVSALFQPGKELYDPASRHLSPLAAGDDGVVLARLRCCPMGKMLITGNDGVN